MGTYWVLFGLAVGAVAVRIALRLGRPEPRAKHRSVGPPTETISLAPKGGFDRRVGMEGDRLP